MTNIADIPLINEAYMDFFNEPRPVRETRSD